MLMDNHLGDSKRFSVEGLIKALKENVTEGYEIYDRVIATTAGLCLMLCTLFGLAFNVLAFIFFQRRTTIFKSKVVLKAASCVDMLICCLSAFVVASLLDRRSPVAFSQDIFCQVWGYCWSFAMKYSATIVSIASLMRVLLMYSPLLVTVKKIKITFVTSAVILLITELLPFFVGKKFIYSDHLGACVPDGFALQTMTATSYRSVLLSYIPGLTYLLPIPISLCCYIISYVKVWQGTSRTHINVRSGASRKRRFRLQATLTISSFMAAYLLLQVPLPVYTVFVVAKVLSGSSLNEAVGSEPWWFSYYMPHVLYIGSVSLNTFLNPVIYYWRLQEFRRFVKEFVFKIHKIALRQSLENTKAKSALLREDINEWNLEMQRVERKEIPMDKDEWKTVLEQTECDTDIEEDNWFTADENTEGFYFST